MEFILGRLYILGGNTRETLLGRLQYAGSSDFIWRTFHGDFMSFKNVFCATVPKHIQVFFYSDFEWCYLKICLVALFTLLSNRSKNRSLTPPPTYFFRKY